MENTEKEDSRIYILSSEKPVRAVVRLGFPLVAGMFIMALYNIVDTYFIGLMRDDFQLAAVNLAYPVMMVMIAVSNIVGTGASSFIARSLGAGNKDMAEHTLTAGMLLTAMNSLIVTAAGLLLLPHIVSGLGAQANTSGFTSQYVSVIFIGSLFNMGCYAAGQFLRGEGSVKLSMIGMVLGIIVNVILDPVFIFLFDLKIAGAAIATVIGNAAGLFVTLWFYAAKKTLLRPSLRYIRPTAVILKEIYWVGVPAALETLLTSAAYIVNNNLAVAYGELTVAAMGVSQKIMSFGSYIYQGMASGTQPIMGYSYGAKNYTRMISVLKAGVLVVSATELFVMAIYSIFAPFLIGCFSETPEIIATGSTVLRTIMFILPFVGAVSMCRMSFQAMGKPLCAFIITIVRQLFLYVPLLLLFDRLFGFGGMIWAQPVTEAVMMTVSILMLYTAIKREERQTGEQE